MASKHTAQQVPDRKELAILPGATHPFEEPGALEAVAEKAAAWFSSKLPSAHHLRTLVPAAH